MKKPEMNHFSTFSQIVSIIQEADQTIEEWILHVIDQVEKVNRNE